MLYSVFCAQQGFSEAGSTTPECYFVAPCKNCRIVKSTQHHKSTRSGLFTFDVCTVCWQSVQKSFHSDIVKLATHELTRCHLCVFCLSFIFDMREKSTAKKRQDGHLCSAKFLKISRAGQHLILSLSSAT